MINYNKNNDKNATNNRSQQSVPKRCLEEKTTNDSNNNNNKNYLNSNYQKRAKTDDNFNQNINRYNNMSNNMTLNRNVMNGLSTNAEHSNQMMDNNRMDAINGADVSDNFDADLNDEEMNFLLSQAVLNEPTPQSTRHSDSNMSIGSYGRSQEDVPMNTNGSENMSVEAMEGRIKILESKLKSLSDESNRFRTQSVQKEKQIQEMKEEYNQRMRDVDRKHQSETAFMKHEISNLSAQNDQLRAIYNPRGKHKPNGRLNVNALMRQNNFCPNFSQQKSQEFWALPTSAMSSQATYISNATVLDPESQSPCFKSPIDVKRLKCGDSSPTEIPATQLMSSGSSYVVPMDTTSGQTTTTSRDVNNSQTMSQSQVQALKWEPIRARFKSKFDANREYLANYFIDQRVELFCDDWVRTPQALTDWSNQLAMI